MYCYSEAFRPGISQINLDSIEHPAAMTCPIDKKLVENASVVACCQSNFCDNCKLQELTPYYLFLSIYYFPPTDSFPLCSFYFPLLFIHCDGNHEDDDLHRKGMQFLFPSRREATSSKRNRTKDVHLFFSFAGSWKLQR